MRAAAAGKAAPHWRRFGPQAWHFFEDARKVRKLFETEVVGDRFDRFAGDHAGISLGETDLAHPVRDGHVVVRSEAALQGAQRDVAEASQFAGAVI